jgi:hypothetical protein
VPAELRGEGGEGGGRLGVELQVLEQRPPRDELRQARLVGGGKLRERQTPQPRAPATDARLIRTCNDDRQECCCCAVWEREMIDGYEKRRARNNLLERNTVEVGGRRGEERREREVLRGTPRAGDAEPEEAREREPCHAVAAREGGG